MDDMITLTLDIKKIRADNLIAFNYSSNILILAFVRTMIMSFGDYLELK